MSIELGSPVLAYGLDIAPLEVENPLVGVRRLPWHRVALRLLSAPPPADTALATTADVASLDAAAYARVVVERYGPQGGPRVTVSSPRYPTASELAHPLLTFAGAVLARWTGRTALHGAPVLLGAHAWVVLAPPDGGKSTLMSALDARGHAVLADDLAVIDAGTVLAGPRSCDLRAEAATRLGSGGLLAVEVGRPRYRVQLEAAPPEAALGGFLALTWGDRWEVTTPGPQRRLALLAAHEALSLGPTTPTSFLELLRLPFTEISRPRDWASLDHTVELLEELGSAS